MFIDSHAHITDDKLYPEVHDLLKRAWNEEVKNIINICTDINTLKRGQNLINRYPWVYHAAATTPHDVEKEGDLFFPLVAKSAINDELVAIGETGLDYYYAHSDQKTQEKFFRRYLQLALECKLPVIIHCRDAFSDFFKIIDSDYSNSPGVLHCFTGSKKEAEGLLERGWYISLSGIVTFKKSDELKEIAKIIPLDRLLIETDAPYLAPQSQRGKQNEPSFIKETAQIIASLKEIDLKELAQMTSENTRTLFKKLTLTTKT